MSLFDSANVGHTPPIREIEMQDQSIRISDQFPSVVRALRAAATAAGAGRSR
jgi:hypothetical protein